MVSNIRIGLVLALAGIAGAALTVICTAAFYATHGCPGC
jgi:hypothetical protein